VFIGDALFLDLRGGEPDAVGHIVGYRSMREDF
jgi:hypothetical protein